MAKKYSELIDALLKLGLLPTTGHGSVQIIIKDYQAKEAIKVTHYLCKDEIVTKEIEKVD
jgi:hypothetical protein